MGRVTALRSWLLSAQSNLRGAKLLGGGSQWYWGYLAPVLTFSSHTAHGWSWDPQLAVRAPGFAPWLVKPPFLYSGRTW